METSSRKAAKAQSPAPSESPNPAHVVREGAVAASIWLRQSPSGYAYYDYSLSRSFKSMSTDKTGYSKNFFENNKRELVSVIDQASAWIAEQREEPVRQQNGALAA